MLLFKQKVKKLKVITQNLIKKLEIKFKNNIVAEDAFKNIIKSKYAEFNNIKNTFKTVGSTSLITSKEYSLEGEDLFFDNKKKIMKSKNLLF